VELSEKDRQLLGLLQVNAREPVASLARQLGVSRTALQERLRKLEANGVIEGYGVRLGSPITQNAIHCFTFCVLNNKSYPEVSRQLKLLTSVQAVHSIAGDWDIIIHLVADTLERLNREVNAVNDIDGIVRTMSHIVLETKLSRSIYGQV
jgi:Transcriptional regulators